MPATLAYAILPGDVGLPAFNSLGDIVSKIVPPIVSLAGLAAFFFLVFGGLRYLSSGGDEKAITEAKKIITNALLGLLIVFVAFWAIRIIETVLGLNITGLNP